MAITTKFITSDGKGFDTYELAYEAENDVINKLAHILSNHSFMVDFGDAEWCVRFPKNTMRDLAKEFISTNLGLRVTQFIANNSVVK